MLFALYHLHRFAVVLILSIFVVMVSACHPGVTISTTAPIQSTATAEIATDPMPSTTVVPLPNKTITIGTTSPADTLFLSQREQSSTTKHVLEAIQPRCINTLNYEEQAVCFTTVPSFANGDVVTTSVRVDASYPTVIELDYDLVEPSTLHTPLDLPQMSITYRLIDGMMWEDGTPVTAADFVFAYELYRNPELQRKGGYIANLDVVLRTVRMEALDDHTFVWTGVPGYTDLISFLNYVGPEPKHILGQMDPTVIGDTAYANHPLAYGPYKVLENTPGTGTTLIANPTYWRANESLPKVDQIIFESIATEDQMLQQLESGEIDVLDGSDRFGRTDLLLNHASVLDRLAAEGKAKTLYVPSKIWEHMTFDIERGEWSTAFFHNVKVRQAVAYAINRQEINYEIMAGKAQVMNSFLPTNHWAYPANGAGLTEYEYDRAKAVALLEEAGWMLSADGIRERKGNKFQILMYSTINNPTHQAVVEIIQRNLREVGIDVVLNLVPAASFYKRVLPGRGFNLVVYAHQSGSDPLLTVYRCKDIPMFINDYTGRNYSAWCNPNYDQLVSAAQKETDRAKQTELLIEAQKIVSAELPMLPLYQHVIVGAHSPKVTGLRLDPTSRSYFWNMEQWDITE